MMTCTCSTSAEKANGTTNLRARRISLAVSKAMVYDWELGVMI